MEYSIPVSKLEKLEKIFRRYQNKGANIVLNIGEEVIEDGMLYIDDPMNHTFHTSTIKVTCKRVFVDGSYKINGWAFVGTIEFTENGNIIRLADSSFEGKVPERYLHTPKICEHCGKIRNRKDTYLIYNEETKEFKQVGSTCLLDYTQGLDANKCADMMSFFVKIVSLANTDVYEDEFRGNGFDSTHYGFDRVNILPMVYAYVSQYGYQRSDAGHGTAHDVYAIATNSFSRDEEYLMKRANTLVPASEEEIKAIDDFAKEHIEDDFGYMRNASLSWLKGCIEYRDFGLIASFVNTYNKEVKKIEQQKAKMSDASNVWVGNVGDRITINVASMRLLYSNSIEIAWHTYADTYCYEIKDEEGHTFIWKSSKNLLVEFKDVKIKDYENFDKERFNDYADDWDIEVIFEYEVKTIVGTIKEHSTYCGTKQTVITRGKVVDKNIVKTTSSYDRR